MFAVNHDYIIRGLFRTQDEAQQMAMQIHDAPAAESNIILDLGSTIPDVFLDWWEQKMSDPNLSGGQRIDIQLYLEWIINTAGVDQPHDFPTVKDVESEFQIYQAMLVENEEETQRIHGHELGGQG